MRDPFQLFAHWYQEWQRVHSAAAHGEASAMTLSTCDSQGRPSARMVLLKDQGPSGFTFVSNYQSHKGLHLAQNPWASLLFYWPVPFRQVRIDGKIAPFSRQESEAYFRTRPRDSQVGAWASEQSRTIPDRHWLENRVREFEERYQGQEIPCPPHWGGYRLTPTRFEFWEGRPHRLHDRLVYELDIKGVWIESRLSP